VSDTINTHYVKGGFATADDVVLATTKTTRTVFYPAVHNGGVRGQIVRQKIGADGTWKDVSEVDFRKLPSDCGVSIELNTEAIEKLHDKLTQLYQVQQQGVALGEPITVGGGNKPDSAGNARGIVMNMSRRCGSVGVWPLPSSRQYV
jgi:hypothetical protein